MLILEQVVCANNQVWQADFEVESQYVKFFNA